MAIVDLYKLLQRRGGLRDYSFISSVPWNGDTFITMRRKPLERTTLLVNAGVNGKSTIPKKKAEGAETGDVMGGSAMKD